MSLEADDARAVASEAAPPDEAAGDREIGAALDAAIGALEPMYREVLVLRDVEGLTAQEVASVLGVTVDAVKSRLHRARIAVRDRLAPLLTPSEPAASPECPDLVPFSRSISRARSGLTNALRWSGTWPSARAARCDAAPSEARSRSAAGRPKGQRPAGGAGSRPTGAVPEVPD